MKPRLGDVKVVRHRVLLDCVGVRAANARNSSRSITSSSSSDVLSLRSIAALAQEGMKRCT